MPITSFELYEKAIGSLNTQQGGHLRPNRNFIQWVNDISMELYRERIAVKEKNYEISDQLSPFLKSVNILVRRVPGEVGDLIVKPTDYSDYSSARYYTNKEGKGCGCEGYDTVDGATGEVCEELDEDEKAALQAEAEENLTENMIRKIPNGKWGAFLKHRTDGPTIKKPGITQFEGGFKIAPKNIGVIRLDYYREPAPATFLYTITNPGAIDEYYQFNTASAPLEWSATLINEFISRIKMRYGQYVREPFLYQTGQNDKNTGA